MTQEQVQPILTDLEEKNSTDQNASGMPEGEETSLDEGNIPEEKQWQEKLLQEISELRKDIESFRSPEDESEKESVSSDNQNVFNQVSEIEEKFKQQYPDYAQATSFLRQKRDQELQLWGVEDPAMRDHIINAEMLGLSEFALKQGHNPAEKAYAMAKALGYTKKHNQHQEAALSLGNLPGNGQLSLSPESLIAMDDDDFNRYWQKVMR